MSATGIAPRTNLKRHDGAPTGWAVADAPIAYGEAVTVMEARARAIAEGAAGELIWLLEHPPIYTAGVSAKPGDLLQPDRFPVFQSGRGGQYTYHGPGQRVAYVMLDLGARGRDTRLLISCLEAWLVGTIRRFGVRGEIRKDRVGVWVARGGGEPPQLEDKIAAIGVRLRRWVSFHGVSLNVSPDLTHFDGIVPCGIRTHGVTSLQDLGFTGSMSDVDSALRNEFHSIFGPTTDAPCPLSNLVAASVV